MESKICSANTRDISSFYSAQTPPYPAKNRQKYIYTRPTFTAINENVIFTFYYAVCV